jgi:hypothetical protein
VVEIDPLASRRKFQGVLDAHCQVSVAFGPTMSE